MVTVDKEEVGAGRPGGGFGASPRLGLLEPGQAGFGLSDRKSRGGLSAAAPDKRQPAWRSWVSQTMDIDPHTLPSLAWAQAPMAIPELSRGRELPRPVLQAIVVCDQAIREVDTNKVTLVGIFDRIQSSEFPLHWARPASVYARVTDAEGEYEVRLELVRLEDEKTVGRSESRVAIGDRMASHEIIFSLNAALVFERPGRYEFRLFADSRHIGGMVLTVIQGA